MHPELGTEVSVMQALECLAVPRLISAAFDRLPACIVSRKYFSTLISINI